MHTQGSQTNSSAGATQASNTQTGQYHHEPRTPYNPGYANANARDGNGTTLSQLISGLSLQNSRGKYGAAKSTTPAAMNTNVDWSTANRTGYNNSFILVPNSTLFGGIAQMPSFVPNSVTGHNDQLSQFPYLSGGVYPNMVTGSMQGYSWPYMMNYDVQDTANNKQSTWSTGDCQKGAQNENTGHLQYFPTPFTPGLDGNSMAGYSYSGLFPQLGSLTLPWQMMKTNNGYVVQDLEALTQQEPAIPRAVPAMWTNPSELTLAKCLENREGITNVYIRGFLPETTDEMLQAYAARFGKIERCKAIVDLDTGLCKGYHLSRYFVSEFWLIVLADSASFSITHSSPARTAFVVSSILAIRPALLRCVFSR